MLKKGIARSALCLLLLAALCAAAAADTVSKPKRAFGLGSVNYIAISPDLRFLATAGQGGAFVWDVEGSALRHRLEGNWSATALAFSHDSQVLAVANAGIIVAWEPENGSQIQEFAGHTAEVTRLRFSPDGQLLLSASADNSVRAWSIQSGAELHSIRTPGSPILDVAISPDGKTIATLDTFLTNCVKIWDLQTERLLRALPKTNWTAQRVIFTPDGNLITVAPDRTLSLWDVESVEEIRTFHGITGAATIVLDAWLPNDSTVAAACNDGSVYLWNLETAALVRVVTGEVMFAAHGVPNDFLTVGANLDHNLRIRQLPGGDTLRVFKGHTTSTHSAVAFSPDGRFVLSGGTESATRLWDRHSGEPIREFIGSPAGTMAALFSPDGSNVLTTLGLPNPGVRLWNTETGEVVRDFLWTGSWPMGAVFSHDGSRIATRSQDQRVRIFEVATGTLTRTITNAAWASAVAFSPTAPLLALASTDFSVDLYNHESGQLLHTFFANAGPVTSLKFSPNGDTLLVAWQDGLMRLFNTFTMDLRREFEAAAFLESAAYSPDGRFILTGEGWPRFTATLWDAQTGEALRTFEGHKWTVSAVAFSGDGRSVLTGAESVREWSVASIAARLKIDNEDGPLRLAWSLGQLQEAAQPTGPWETLPNAVRPLTISLESPARFYRVRVDGAE